MKKIYKRENQNMLVTRPNEIGWNYSILPGNFAITQKEREDQMRRQRRR